MPSFCAVVNCGRRGNRDKERFFRLPAVTKFRGQHIEALSLQRREAWIKALKREDFHESTQKYARICSRHFITGEPAQLQDVGNPDWVPNQNMGYITGDSLTVQAVDRYRRVVNRAKRLKQDDLRAAKWSLESQAAEGQQEVGADYDEEAISENDESGVQTDLKANDIMVSQQQLNFCNK